MDIGDLELSGVGVVRGCGLVGVGKHLCGAATDMALRSIVSAMQGGMAGGCGPNVHGIAIALCCHHACSWEELAGRDFLSHLGFSAHHFHLLSHMTSWAVCGCRPPATQSKWHIH